MKNPIFLILFIEITLEDLEEMDKLRAHFKDTTESQADETPKRGCNQTSDSGPSVLHSPSQKW